jgi:hypothetical protein
MMKKMFGSLLIVFAILLLPAGSPYAAEITKLIIAHGAISNNVAPLWAAKEQGIYRHQKSSAKFAAQ